MNKAFAYGDKRKYIVDALTGCWLWQGAKDSWGYGSVRHPVTKKVVGAHILFYELEVGRKVSKYKELDHLCQQRSCVNPQHLEEKDWDLNRPGHVWPVWYLNRDEETLLCELWEAGVAMNTIMFALMSSRATVVIALRKLGYIKLRRRKKVK